MNLRVLGVRNHQMLSFNKRFALMKPGENVFWPGCAMLSYGSELNTAVYELLKTQVSDLSISTFCCGHPSMHIDGGKDFQGRLDSIKKELLGKGVKNIFTLCPNCYFTLSKLSEFNVKSAWSMLDEALPEESYGRLKGRSFTIHDPCPIVHDIEAADHVRNMLVNLGAEVVEFDKNRENTMCCGKKNMIMALEPAKGKKIFDVRAKQVKTEEVVSYCASCVDTFRTHNFNSHHILELMFDIKASASWLNRYGAVDGFRKG